MALSDQQREILNAYGDGSPYTCACPATKTCPVLPCTNDRRDIFTEVEAMLAKAWDQGTRTGSSRAMRRMSDEPNLPLASAADNPYKES